MYLEGTSGLGGTLYQQNMDAAPLKCGALEPASRFG